MATSRAEHMSNKKKNRSKQEQTHTDIKANTEKRSRSFIQNKTQKWLGKQSLGTNKDTVRRLHISNLPQVQVHILVISSILFEKIRSP